MTMTKFDRLQSSSVQLLLLLYVLSSACRISALQTPGQLTSALSERNDVALFKGPILSTSLAGANHQPVLSWLLFKVNSLKGDPLNVHPSSSPKVNLSPVNSSQVNASQVNASQAHSSVSDHHERELNTQRNVTNDDLRPLHRSVRSPRKARKQRSSSPKRKVKRLVLRIENFPFLKLFSTRKLIRKRFVRRNVRSGLSSARFNRPKFKVR